MDSPIAFVIDADTYPKAIKALQKMPRDQWPNPADYDRVYLGCRLFEMECDERQINN